MNGLAYKWKPGNGVEFLSNEEQLKKFTTSDLLEEVGRRELREKDRGLSHLLPIHREFLLFCANYFGVPAGQLVGPERHREISNPRQVAMVVAKKVFRLSGSQAAALLSRKNYTSLHWARKVLAKNPALAADAKHLETKWKTERNEQKQS